MGLAGDCAFKRGKIPERKRRCCVSCRKSRFGGLWKSGRGPVRKSGGRGRFVSRFDTSVAEKQGKGGRTSEGGKRRRKVGGRGEMEGWMAASGCDA